MPAFLTNRWECFVPKSYFVSQVATGLIDAVEGSSAVAGVVGLGYVGLPLAMEIGRAGLRTLGFDVSTSVVDRLNHGHSHVLDVPSGVLREQVQSNRFSATTDPARLVECDLISICVPTPLSKTKDPDLSYVI